MQIILCIDFLLFVKSNGENKISLKKKKRKEKERTNKNKKNNVPQ